MPLFNFNINTFKKNFIFYLFLFFCALLPFQFALNPAANIDLAIVRVIIPLLFLGWVFWALKNKAEVFNFNKISALFLLYLFFAVFSVIFANNFSWAIRKLLFLFSISPIFFVAISILKTQAEHCRVFLALTYGGAILAIIAIAQFIGQFIFGIDNVYTFLANHIMPFFLGQNFSKTVAAYPSWLVSADNTTYMRAIAIFPDPHMLSYYFGMLIPWSIVLSVKKKSSLLFVSTFLLIVADALTFTRGGYLALIAGGVVILPLVSKKTALKIILGIASFAILFSIIPVNPVGSRLASSFDVEEGSNKARISNWQQAFAVIKQHPFGVGIGNYSLAINPKATYREPIYAHNLYLDTAAELGIFAALTLLAILFFSFKNFWLASKTNSFNVAGVASITIFSIHSLVENPFYSVHIFPLFLILIAIALTAPGGHCHSGLAVPVLRRDPESSPT